VIARAPAKLNLALVVGPVRPDGKHELLTIFQRVDLADRIDVEPASDTTIKGFPADTLVRDALEALGAPHGWRVRIEKRVPVAAGLGGGSSDAAAALQLANAQLDDPFEPSELHELAARLGSDVPFFLYDGPQLGSGDGSTLEPIELPQDFTVVLLLPEGAVKASTAAVYADFDMRDGAVGYDERAELLRTRLNSVAQALDLAALPPNDLATSPLETEFLKAGAFRAGVSGAGPVVYGLFEERTVASTAARRLRRHGTTWHTVPVWSGRAR
jgi:4-diphosphocytidyl-2-C-methyl-D-erythritol kinase